jgi:molecular chaperone GrpE
LTKRKYESKNDSNILKPKQEDNQPETNVNNNVSGSNVETAALSQDTENLEKDRQEEKEKAEKYLDNWRRTQADYDNYRKRTDKERSEMSLNTTCDVVGSLLEVIDDLERALSFIPPTEKTPLVEGVRMTHRKLLNQLEKLGMEEVCALGKGFDPSLHEAIAHTQGEEGTVIGEVQKGYKLRGKLLRPSRVVVGKGVENTGNKIGE